MKPLSPKTQYELVAESDLGLPKDEQTVFVYRPLTVAEQALLADHSGAVDEVTGKWQMSMGTQSLMAIHIGLIEVRNFKEDDGSKIELVREDELRYGAYYEIKESFLERISLLERNRLGGHIRGTLTPGVVDSKN